MRRVTSDSQVLGRNSVAIIVIIAGVAISLGFYAFILQVPPDTEPIDQPTIIQEPTVSILECDGRCGDLAEPVLMLERVGDDAIVTFQESAGVPCFRHVISQVFILERKPPIIDITLQLESTSDACVECVGLIESRIRVGPVERGTEIVV
ncbi:MAG: hypothetical protein O7B30_01305, partial [Thaumarchaeota archaeon]|nr:hypothetical protein [Nitrososphaerota archaeon]